MKKKSVCIVLCVLGVLSAVSSASPSYITNGTMTWQRGDGGSTWQEWEFTTPNNPALPETSGNQYGLPTIDFTGTNGSVPFQWQNGVWMGDPIYALVSIPNSPDPNPYKIVFFEMTYKAVDMLVPQLTAGAGYSIQPIYSNDVAGSSDWRVMTRGWIIRPNPTEEWINFALAGTGGFIDSVYVDTICIPEPATFAIFSIGILAASLKKKKTA